MVVDGGRGVGDGVVGYLVRDVNTVEAGGARVCHVLTEMVVGVGVVLEFNRSESVQYSIKEIAEGCWWEGIVR